MTDLFHEFNEGQAVAFTDKTGIQRQGKIKYHIDDKFYVAYPHIETNTTWIEAYTADDLRDA